MSIKKLFEDNKQTGLTGKYLQKTSEVMSGSGIESGAHLAESIKKEETFLPPIDYSDPKKFAYFGSGEKYYENAFNYILDYYPYDGSGYEKTKFYNDLNPLEKYILEEKYPRAMGHAVLGTVYGAVSDAGTTYFSSSAEYLQAKGGPHSGTIYSTGSNRTSNLEFGGPSGSTVEFLFNKETGIPDGGTQSESQIVLDLWNGISTGTKANPNPSYGRMTIEILSGSEDRFYVTMQSGSNVGFLTQSVPTTGGLSLAGGGWNHYAFAFDTNSSIPILNFYVNGACAEQGIVMSGSTPDDHTSIGEIKTVTGSMIVNVGGLRTAPSGNTTAAEGWAKLSASIDEFRFWKSDRNSKQVGRYWFSSVNGGTNNHDANKALGVYFKFNEGMASTSAVNKTALDYSGRLSNGIFRGYNASYTRATSSAINSMNLNDVVDLGDYVLRETDTDLISIKTELVSNGREHDYGNTSYLMNTLPNWIYEEDINNGDQLRALTQIMSSYFDTLQLQISELRKIKNINYVSGSLTGSVNEFPHNERLITSLGLQTPELFANIDAFERYFQRDDNLTFDQSVENIKNVIYKNIYNNLQSIYKSKGTEKAIRNLVRCFGIDDDIVSLKVYSDNLEYDLETNYKTVSSKKKYADFSGLRAKESSKATIYQHYDSNNASSVGYFTGSNLLDTHALTAECEIIFPNRQERESLPYETYNFVTSSLFGFHTPKNSSVTSTDATWAPETGSHPVGFDAVSCIDTGLQIYAVKSPAPFAEITSPAYEVKDVFFIVKNRHNETLLQTDIFQNVYNNQKWNLALTIKNSKHPYAVGITGATTGSYTLNLYGVNYDSGIKRQSFSTSTTLTYPSGSDILTNSKKFYLGSHRTNFSGALLQNSDVRGSSLRVWNSYLTSSVIDLHAKESEAFGTKAPYQQVYSFESASHGLDGRIPQSYIPSIQSLGLNWDFANLTGSDSSGRFTVSDFSSGSNNGDYQSSYQGNTFSKINLRQMTGRGDLFPTSSNKVIIKEFVPTQRKQLPEYVFSDDMIEILPADVEVFTPNRRPVNFYFSIEKSMYNSISRRILQFFASLDEFNNLIGEPVNRYRDNYKSLEKLRELFFSRVGNVPDFDRYYKYYKWIDNTIAVLAQQLFPASAKHREGMQTIIESHVLERPKVKYNYLGDRTKRTDRGEPIANAVMAQHAQSQTSQEEADPGRPPVQGWVPPQEEPNDRGGSSGGTNNLLLGAGTWPADGRPDNNSNQSRQFPPAYYQTNAPLYLPEMGLLDLDTDITSSLSFIRAAARSSQVGTGFFTNYAVLMTPRIEDTARVFLPLASTKETPGSSLTFPETLTLSGFDFSNQSQFLNYDFVPNVKKPINFKAIGSGLEHTTARNMVPFSAFSSSISTGYRASMVESGLSNVDFTNLHFDSYGTYGKRSPIQGPFTEYHVGGLQSRHVAPLATSERKEAFKVDIDASSFTVSKITTSSGIQGRYRRGTGTKRPVNIANIVSYTGSVDAASGVKTVGNYTRNYEVIHTSDRSLTNMDFVFRNSEYYTASAMKIPSAFVTPPAVRDAGLTGSFDFKNAREQSGARINKTIISSRFAAPGSRHDSKQQFRDISSDLISPNNALPWRNTFVVGNAWGFGTLVSARCCWGGFMGGTQCSTVPTFLALTGANGLSELNDGFDPSLAAGNPYPTWTPYRVTGSGIAHPFHKIQRNITMRISEVWSGVQGYGNGNPMLMAMTASRADNFNVVRPVPAADRTPWFMRAAVGGASNTNIVDQAQVWPPTYTIPNLYNQWAQSGSIYPEDITYTTSSLGETYNYGTAVFTGSNNEVNYLWGDELGFYPHTQIRASENALSAYNKRRNLYRFAPYSIPTGKDTRRYADGTLSVTTIDRAGNNVLSKYSLQFTEPPITSRYQPIVHKVKAFSGTPSSTNTTAKPLTMIYSYGNDLQGFANREINENLGFNRGFLEGIEKRPYELLRDDAANNLGKNITGINSIDLMLYSETVYPKEIYTYLSGTRARQAFSNNFWKDDKNITTDTLTIGQATSNIEDSTELVLDSNVKKFTRQSTRLSGNFAGRLVSDSSYPFVTSQGYRVQSLDQYPYNSQLSSSIGGPTASAYRRGYFTGSSVDDDDNNYGFGSIWPMDSYLYSDSSGSLLGALTGSAPILLADAGTMASGELLMTHYGTIDDRITVSKTGSVLGSTTTYTPSGSAYYQTSSVVSAQYLYNVPTEVTFSAVAPVTAVAATASVTIDSADPDAWNNADLIISDISPFDGATVRTFTFKGDKETSVISRTDPFEYNVGLEDLSSENDIAVAFSASIVLAHNNASDLFQMLPHVGGSSDVLQLTASLAYLPGATGNSFDPEGDTTGGLYTRNGAFLGGVSAAAALDGGFRAEPRSPGSVFTRPSWTAGRERKYVDGASKGQLAPKVYPFYNTYEDYVNDARFVGKDYGIIPEFRISEHIETYKNNGSVMASVTDSLTLTGSSTNVNDSSDNEFLTRYTTSDMMEYLDTFIRPESTDLEFNKYPTNLKLESRAIVKLLPYDGFYPQTRTLELATMFSQSYAPSSSYTINNGRAAGPYQWRPLLKPFFAPGILYNSIKSGVAVDYPISRDGRNQGQFLTSSLAKPLYGCLSGTVSVGAGTIPDNRRRRKTATSGNFDFLNTNVDGFFWGDSIPFEGILKPLNYISDKQSGLTSTEVNKLLHTDITASVSPDASNNDLLYRLATSNFLAAVPEFFLKEKSDGTYLTKFTAELPQRSSKISAQGTAPSSQEVPRTVQVQSDTAYIMEIGLKKTDNFNLYSNPYAFGTPTATGSSDGTEWDEDDVATTASYGLTPQGKNWPLHRGQFAPFTAPYYYGPSLVRITYFPESSKDVTLKEILYGTETYVEFLNSNGHYYDFDSGSYVDEKGTTLTTSYTPGYKWNRAWQNRQDIDASIIVDNLFPTEGSDISPFDENKWVIMPKWESPILDFPNRSGNYNFSSSVTPTEYTSSAFGMWHQYGISPKEGEGVYLYLSDVDNDSTEFRLVGDVDGGSGKASGKVRSTKKVPTFVVDSGRKISSLGTLVGFDPKLIMPANQWMPERAKRLGELADDGEKLLSEGIIAIPFYLEGHEERIKAITLTGDPSQLGPKLKEFRRAFTKYSMPPALRKSLLGLLPKTYPGRPEFINPFGADDYEEILSGEDLITTPTVYLFEHSTELTKQNLADMWQGIMPDLATGVKNSFTSIDHYMPGDALNNQSRKIFPEIVEDQISLKLPRTGVPRVDLLDVVPEGDTNGFQQEIRWLVFKVKQRGKLNYTQMMIEEINDGPQTLSAENMLGYLSKELPPQLLKVLETQRDELTKSQYHSETVGVGRNTYNWPYDYCSLVELTKLRAVVGFRPDLESLESSTKSEEATSGVTNFAAGSTLSSAKNSLEEGSTNNSSGLTTYGLTRGK